MSIHLLIIDALNLIRRIHAVQGSPCAPGCRKSILQLLQHVRPTHAVAVFDSIDRHLGWRYQLLPNYKSGRPPMPSLLQQELPHLQEMIIQLGIACWQLPEQEADDVIATLVNKVNQQQHTVTLISTDKSYCQLLKTHLRIRDYFQKRWLDETFVQQIFGVSSHLLPDYWGLAGINSCKLAGVPGIGSKTAAALLQRFTSLDNIYANLDKLPDKLAYTLQQYRDQAYLCKQLATLQTELSVQGNLQQLRWTAPLAEDLIYT